MMYEAQIMQGLLRALTVNTMKEFALMLTYLKERGTPKGILYSKIKKYDKVSKKEHILKNLQHTARLSKQSALRRSQTPEPGSFSKLLSPQQKSPSASIK